MPLRISFNLGDADLQHFAHVAQQTQASARELSSQAVIAVAREVLEGAERAQLADFVKERFSRLRSILSMATDPEWPLVIEDNQRIINALACFGGAPSSAGAANVSFLDHAIMIELVSRDLEHDLAAYSDFCKFRDSLANRSRAGADPNAQREERLKQKREILQDRMHKRRKRALDAAGSSVRKLFSLFGI